MKISTLAAALVLATVPTTGAFSQTKPLIQMSFSDVEVSQVFRAITLRTGVSIVYSNKEKLRITISSSAQSVEEAIRQVASLSGLVYRKVDKTFIVGTATTLRQALEPYGTKASFTLEPDQAAKALPILTEELPYATARVVGDKLIVVATLEDLKEAKDLLDTFQRREVAHAPTSKAVTLRYLSYVQASGFLKTLYSDVTILGRDDQQGGAYVLTGPADRVRSAIQILTEMDVQTVHDSSQDTIFKIYNLRYVSANIVTDFIKKAAPDVEAIIGPEAYSPPRANFNPLTSELSSVGGGGGTGGSSSGGSSGQSSGGGSTGGGGSSGGTAGPDHQYKQGDRARTVVLKGKEAAVNEVLKLLKSLDVKPRQVVIDVSVIETSPTFTEDMGLDWNLTNTQTIAEQSFGAAGIGFGRFTRTTPLTFTATLNAAVTHGIASLLAHPHVQVMDNDDADVFIGDTIYTQIAQATGLGGQTVSVQAFNIGIILLIRPRIDPDGNISMHVNPVVSTLTSITSNGLPQTSSREAESTVIVKDGETVVIGGLVREDDSKTITEVPFLSKLPVVGQLFRNRNTSKTHKDVIVSITPHIVPDTEAGH